MSAETLSIIRPDDWHLHLRDDTALTTTVPHSARVFARAVVMPNLKPPVVTVADALAYHSRIQAAVPADMHFEPLMTLYLTDNTSKIDVEQAAADDRIIGIKYYPAGATTNSESGVTQLSKAYDVIERMQEVGLPLLIHGETTDPKTDIFDREAQFINDTLAPLQQRFPELRIVLEHITTSDAVQYVTEHSANLGATITVHHLLYNRTDMLAGGIKPHYFCMPILKRDTHQEALIRAATSGNTSFFLGTDSAPHLVATKLSSCGCAGVYSAPAAIELYATVFEAADALDHLEGFSSFNGADFYGLPRNTDRITLQRQEWQMPASFKFEDDVVIPIATSQTLRWKVKGSTG